MKSIIIKLFCVSALLLFCQCKLQDEIFRGLRKERSGYGFLQIIIDDNPSMRSNVEFFGRKKLPSEHNYLQNFEQESDFYIKSGKSNALEIDEGEYFAEMKFESGQNFPLAFSDITRRTILFGFEYRAVSDDFFAEKKFFPSSLEKCIASNQEILCPKLKIEAGKKKEIMISTGNMMLFNGKETARLWLEMIKIPFGPFVVGFLVTSRDVSVIEKDKSN